MSRNRKKRKKMLAAAFGGLCALLLIDRLFLGGSTSAVEEAQAAQTPVAVAHAVPERSDSEGGTRTEVHPAMVAERFEAFREGSPFEIAQLSDVFGLAEWAQVSSSEPISASPGISDRDPSANEFRKRHRLHAVIRGGSTEGVILDGAFLKVGREVDGYMLRETTPRSAVFVRGETEIRLELIDPGS